MKSPFFSIIVPLFNRENSISKAIESILNQTFQDFELIIVDDCSTDSSVDIVSQYQIQDTRIKIFKNKKNQERCVTRNRGIDESQGKYICFLDSDDYHLPFHLESFYSKIVEENYPNSFMFSSAWNETEEGLRTARVCPEIGDMNLYHYFLTYTVNPQRWCIESSVAKHILFDPEIVICEDLDFSLRVVLKGIPVFQIPIQTTVYVAAKDSFTHGDTQKWEKELFFLNRILEKKELRNKLSKKDKNRQLSIRYYFIASKSKDLGLRWDTIYFSIKSICLFPKGYKKGILKDLLVLILVSLPAISRLRKLL